MNKTILLNKFSRGMFWNGLTYGIYKVLSILLTVSLYKTLCHEDFSLWAVTNSCIFILLLWLDCGFRKSIPRYCPAFAKNKNTHRQFVSGLVLFQVGLLSLVGLPLLKVFLAHFNFTFHWYIFGVFATEGMIAILRLIYHAHFWQKEFNLLHTSFILIEMLFNFWVLASGVTGINLIEGVFITKMCAGFATIFISLFLLPTLYKDKMYPGNEHIDTKKISIDFITHSAVMWATTSLKSLSERNVLLPYLTLVIGAPTANFFKISQDAALFFQRIVLKTIGITDTSLLSHLEEQHNSQATVKKTFSYLLRKIIFLCSVLFLLGIVSAYYTTSIYKNDQLIKLFIIILSGYTVEMALSPYERFLETKRQYKWLWFSYLPYTITMFMCCVFIAPQRFSLPFFFLIVQGARISGSVLMGIIVKKKFNL